MSNKLSGVDRAYYQPHQYPFANFQNNPDDNRLGILERMYMRLLTEMAANRFEWKNMPDTVNVRYMELTLFNRALAVFYDEPSIGYLALSGAGNGRINWYGDPLGFRVYGGAVITRGVPVAPQFDSDGNTLSRGCVPIWSNYLRIPDHDIVMVYATKLAQIDRSIEINAENARVNTILQVEENGQLTAKNIEKMIRGGALTIPVKRDLNLADMIVALDLGGNPDKIEKLHIVKTRLFNECMGLLGINNSNQDKKERMVANEVDGNNDQIEAIRQVNLNSRQLAADQINDKFGLNVSVDFYSPPDEVADPTTEPKGVDA